MGSRRVALTLVTIYIKLLTFSRTTKWLWFSESVWGNAWTQCGNHCNLGYHSRSKWSYLIGKLIVYMLYICYNNRYYWWWSILEEENRYGSCADIVYSNWWSCLHMQPQKIITSLYTVICKNFVVKKISFCTKWQNFLFDMDKILLHENF